MKVAVVWSSPNSGGLTASAKEHFLAGLTRAGAGIEEIPLNRMKIEHCTACGSGWGVCRSEGRCWKKDDFQQIYQKLTEADGIIWVTAVYWHDATEQMKAFLDRLRRCETAHNGYLAGKRCILAACAGGTGLGAVECLHQMEEALKHMGMRAYDRISVIRYNKDYILPAIETAGEVYAQRLETGFDMQY
jgi:multimeric flavodoxin WrbA